uniref:Uncharacterized protein n=1 Tax=Neisseria leonii TaxID=2995413 RepID=A0A9X4DZZ0_9NEIS|nr:hypothetical protein [Neisseria sp. 51.81]
MTAAMVQAAAMGCKQIKDRRFFVKKDVSGKKRQAGMGRDLAVSMH